MRISQIGTVSLVAMLCVTSANAARCKGGGPADAVDTARNFSVCLKSDIGCAGLHVADYRNDGGFGGQILPSTGRNESYYEARVGAAAGGAAGTRRLVFLLKGARGGGGKTSIEAKYFTDNHYKTFCEL